MLPNQNILELRKVSDMSKSHNYLMAKLGLPDQKSYKLVTLAGTECSP